MARAEVRDSFVPPMWVVMLGVLALLIWLLAALKEIVSLVVVGFCAAYVMEPPLAWLERRRVPRAVGVIVLVVALLLVLLLLALTAVPTLAREYRALTHNLPSYVAAAQEKLRPVLARAEEYLPVGRVVEMPLEQLSAYGGRLLQKMAAGLSSALLAGYSVTLTLFNLALLPFIIFYLAVDFPQLHGAFTGLFPFVYRSKVEEILGETNGYVSAFVRGQLLICTILAGLYAAGLAIIGVELWHLLALIGGFGNMIPYFGTIFGVVLSSIMALVTFGDFTHVALVWLVFVAAQALTDNCITPRIQGERVGLSPLVIMLALLVGGSLFGFLGVMLAIPGAAILKVAVRHFRIWAWSRC